MVKLTEVEDEHFREKPTSAKDNVLLASDDEDEDFTDTDSEISTESYEELETESLLQRIGALRDIIPPQSRHRIASTFSALSSFSKSTVAFGGKSLWVITTSVFLLGVPWAMAMAEEQQYVQMEREQGMIKGANEMLTPGAANALTAQDDITGVAATDAPAS